MLRGEAVAATDKIVSIFDRTPTSSSRTDARHGHKVCRNLTSGASGMVLDLVVQRRNPADSRLAQSVVARVESVLGKTPKQVSFDGGFSSKAIRRYRRAAAAVLRLDEMPF